MKKYRTENLAISSGIAASKKDEWKEESNGPGKNPDNLPRGIDKIKDSDIKYLNRNQALKLKSEKELTKKFFFYEHM